MPEVEPGGILVKVTGGVCGWDLHLWRGDIYIVPVSFYSPRLLPAALEMLERTRDRHPLADLMSHSFGLEEINAAFETAEWFGKDRETAVTRAVVKP